MKAPIILPCVFFALACTPEKSQQTDTAQPSESMEVAATPVCYVAILGQDTLSLRVENLSNEVTGNLAYNFYEKDDNQGTLKGQMHGDTLLADYAFMSEGTESVRQVAFLKKEGGFVEGYGEMQDQNGKMVFKNTAALDFKSGTPFEKVPCPE